ncbi:hypothetical protein TNCV_3586401 [Trichonephila clavipes]|nr:hypothetical protein TNCV_3586401 [Trichonephila clavipes]
MRHPSGLMVSAADFYAVEPVSKSRKRNLLLESIFSKISNPFSKKIEAFCQIPNNVNRSFTGLKTRVLKRLALAYAFLRANQLSVPDSGYPAVLERHHYPLLNCLPGKIDNFFSKIMNFFRLRYWFHLSFSDEKKGSFFSKRHLYKVPPLKQRTNRRYLKNALLQVRNGLQQGEVVVDFTPAHPRPMA